MQGSGCRRGGVLHGSRELRPKSHWRTCEQGFFGSDLFGGAEVVTRLAIVITVGAVERSSVLTRLLCGCRM